MAKYFVVTCGEDGMDIRQVTEAELKKLITPNKEGYQEIGSGGFLQTVPVIDDGYWEADEFAALIIKGEIVTPRPVKTVTKWEV